MLIIGIVWLVMSSLVIFGPLLLSGKVANWLLASVGGVSGLITVAGGWSARSAAKPASAATTGLASRLGRLTLPAAAAIFAAVLVLAVSWLTSGLLGWLEGLTVARSQGAVPPQWPFVANGSERPRASAARGPGVAGAGGRRRPRPARRRCRPAREHQPLLAARDVPRPADSRLPGSVARRARGGQPVHRLRRDDNSACTSCGRAAGSPPAAARASRPALPRRQHGAQSGRTASGWPGRTARPQTFTGDAAARRQHASATMAATAGRARAGRTAAAATAAARHLARNGDHDLRRRREPQHGLSLLAPGHLPADVLQRPPRLVAREPGPGGRTTRSICRARASPSAPHRRRGLRPDRRTGSRTSTCRTAGTSRTSGSTRWSCAAAT